MAAIAGRAPALTLPLVCAAGVCHFELGQCDQAHAKFTQALSLNDQFAPSYSNRANCLKALKRYDEAEADYSKAIEIDNRNPKAFLSRAQLLEAVSKPIDALADYKKVVELWAAHEAAIKKVVALSPDVDAAATHRGWLHKRGHMNVQYQRRYFLLHGAMVSYYNDVDAARKGKSKGEPIVARVAHVRPAQVGELSAEKASLAFQFESTEGKVFIVYADSPEEKLGWLQAIGRAVGGGHGAERQPVEKAYAELILGGESEASAATARGEGAGGATGWALIAQGARLVKAGSADEARLVLEKAGAASRENTASGVYVCSQYLLGKLLQTKGFHVEATSYLRNAAASAPPSCNQIIRLQTAWSMWHSNQQQAAEGMYWQVLDDDVLCWQALVDRGRMHLATQAWGAALCDLAQVAAMGKADADVCNDLGVSHFEVGNDERACYWFGEAVSKNEKHAPAISNRANCLKRQGKLREAESDYTRAIEIDGSNPKAFMNRGLLLREQGMNSRAHRDYERALALDPHNAVLQNEVRAIADKLAEAGVSAAPTRGTDTGGGGGGGGGAGGDEEGVPLRRERL
jgi:tetratricopeptide (TPR) repeat protein